MLTTDSRLREVSPFTTEDRIETYTSPAPIQGRCSGGHKETLPGSPNLDKQQGAEHQGVSKMEESIVCVCEVILFHTCAGDSVHEMENFGVWFE